MSLETNRPEISFDLPLNKYAFKYVMLFCIMTNSHGTRTLSIPGQTTSLMQLSNEVLFYFKIG